METVRKFVNPILISGAIGTWILSLLFSYKGFEQMMGRDPSNTFIAVAIFTAVEVLFFWLVLPRLARLTQRIRRWMYPQRRRR